jgi:hypothetical protein
MVQGYDQQLKASYDSQLHAEDRSVTTNPAREEAGDCAFHGDLTLSTHQDLQSDLLV